MSKKSIRGLYGITIDNDPDIESNVKASIIGGASIIQYRDKFSSIEEKLKIAKKIKQLCKGRALFIINDNVDLALAVDADGVHLGEQDEGIAKARQSLGNDKIIGVSCYNQIELAQRAQAASADYVAFGRFFSSSTKPNATPASIDLLKNAKQILSLPIVTIGGITEKNANELVSSGADAIAVIDGLYNQPNIIKTAQNFCDLF